MTSVIDKLKNEQEIAKATHRTDENEVRVFYDTNGKGAHVFTETEVTLIREGKLTPLRSDEWQTAYEPHLTLDEQDEQRESKFSFSV